MAEYKLSRNLRSLGRRGCQYLEVILNLTAYYQEICKQPILSREEELELFSELKNEATPLKRQEVLKDKIIKSNLRFVFKTAKAYSKNDPDSFSELISAGNEGLLVGLEKYNPESGVRFLSYAGWWVTQRILKEMSKMRIVSLPIWKQQLASRIQKAKDSNEKVTLEELKALFPEASSRDLTELHQTKYLTYYIEDMTDDPAFEINPIEDEVEKRMEKEALISKVASMQEPHRSIIVYTFGLHNGQEVTDSATAKKLGLSKEAFKRTKEDALKMLREMY